MKDFWQGFLKFLLWVVIIIVFYLAVLVIACLTIITAYAVGWLWSALM